MNLKTQQSVDPSIHDKTPLTKAAHHIEVEVKLKQQNNVPVSAENKIVSHVPVSVGSETRSSSSTLCSLASKVGPEIEDFICPATFNEKLTNKLSVASKDERMDLSCSSISVKSRASEAIGRPAKKARTVTDDPANESCITPPRNLSPLSNQNHSSLLLLAEEGDVLHLNPLHVFVRKQIEVFAATATELAQPAPGRKQAIQLNQVGLRCIHCRNNILNGDKKARVKRAVCYPSSVSRIYHSVSDMKCDHFTHCRHLPPDVRKTFETLKGEGSRQSKSLIGKNKFQSSFSTSQYYRESATRIGLFDGPGGIINMNNMSNRNAQNRTNTEKMITAICDPPHVISEESLTKSSSPSQHQLENYAKLVIQQQTLTAVNATAVASMLLPQMHISNILAANSTQVNINPQLKHLTQLMNSTLLRPLLTSAVIAGANAQKSIDAATALAKHEGKPSTQRPLLNPLKRSNESSHSSSTAITPIVPRVNSEVPLKRITVPLSAPKDAEALNPIHCFIRKHVEFFSADDEDIAAPCPGRKTRVTLGQVGIRCKHCAKLKISPKERAKRTVCYPPSLDGIYHSVSNMKFDHFGICPSLPASARDELTALRTYSSGRRQANGSNNKSITSLSNGSVNTAEYYRLSAAEMGLVDTVKGIRFSDSCSDASTSLGEICLQHRTGGNSNAASITSPTPVHKPCLTKDESPTKFPTRMSVLMEAASKVHCI